MPNPKLETYKNKATGTVYDYTDAAAQAALAGILDGTDIESFEDVETALATKVDKVAGKGLSTNDYDDTEKAKVAGAFPRSEQAVLGAKNEFENKAVSGTDGGVTFTVNSDKSVTLNGHNTSSDRVNLPMNTYPYDAVKGKILNGVTGGSTESYMIFARFQNAQGGYVSEVDCVNGDILIPDNVANVETVWFTARVNTGYEFASPVTIYPMIREATDPDPTYAPYAMTNEELTDAIAFPNASEMIIPNIIKEGGTTPRVKDVVGGYKQIKKTVFVDIVCKANIAMSCTSKQYPALENWGLVNTLPIPQHDTPLLALVIRGSAQYAVFAKISTNTSLYILGSDFAIAEDDYIYFRGTYEAV